MRETGRLRVMGAAGGPEEAGGYLPLRGFSSVQSLPGAPGRALSLLSQKTVPVFVPPQAPGIGGLGICAN